MKTIYGNEHLYTLAHQILLATQYVDQERGSKDTLLTSADLARQLRLKHDYVKKQLRYLKDLDIIRPIGLNPKRYRFDTFRLERLLCEEHTDEALEALLTRLHEACLA